MPKWIKFIEYTTTRKSKHVGVWNKDETIDLGWILWHPSFRTYSFCPKPNTVFEKTTMLDIIAEIDRLTEERKKQKAGNKTIPGL